MRVFGAGALAKAFVQFKKLGKVEIFVLFQFPKA